MSCCTLWPREEDPVLHDHYAGNLLTKGWGGLYSKEEKLYRRWVIRWLKERHGKDWHKLVGAPCFGQDVAKHAEDEMGLPNRRGALRYEGSGEGGTE